MLNLILNNSHLLCAQSTKTPQGLIVTSLGFRKFSRTLKDVIHDDRKLSSLLQPAFRSIAKSCPFSGDKVYVALDDDLLYQDFLVSEEDFSTDDAWEYILWSAKQRWGDQHKQYSTFSQSYFEKQNEYQVISCPINLINQINKIIKEMNAEPVWMGLFSEILLEGDKNSNNIFIFDQGKSYRVFHRDRYGYVSGIVRFTSGKFKIQSSIGREQTLKSIFQELDKTVQIRCVDQLTKGKMAHWKKMRFTVLQPLQDINTKGIKMPVDVSQRGLNILTKLIGGNAAEVSINLFNIPYIHDILPKPVIIVKEKELKTEPVEPSKKPVRKEAKTIKRSFQFQEAFIGLLITGILSGSIYFKLNKKEINFSFLTQLVSKVMTSEETAIEVRPGFQHKEEGINSKTAPFQAQYNTSQSLLNTVTYVLNTISISEMFSLSIQDLKMELAWTGDKDTGFLNSLEGVSMQLEKDEDNKHHLVVMLGEKVVAVPGSRIERDELITIISDKFNQSKFRLLETIENGEEGFDPLILQIDSIEKAHKFTKWVSGLAGNIIVRKVEVNNQLNIQDSNAVFHIAVFKDNFHS